MACYREEFSITTRSHDELVDVTERVRRVVERSGARDGLCSIYTPHATAAIAINENADPNVCTDVLEALRKMVPDHAGWLHDRVDDNAAAHIKATVLGPSQSVPIAGGKLMLGSWQNIFLCEFDGPRDGRRVVVSTLF
ncbi:MAG: YjbQ family protein [Myxococcales bacterium]|nr:YjbQ family protein [Myxococcales bacterium]